MEFREFNLDSRLMEGIQNAGYVNCTPVQEQVIACANDGSDLYVQSQTGTGKTTFIFNNCHIRYNQIISFLIINQKQRKEKHKGESTHNTNARSTGKDQLILYL